MESQDEDSDDDDPFKSFESVIGDTNLDNENELSSISNIASTRYESLTLVSNSEDSDEKKLQIPPDREENDHHIAIIVLLMIVWLIGMYFLTDYMNENGYYDEELDRRLA